MSIPPFEITRVTVHHKKDISICIERHMGSTSMHKDYVGWEKSFSVKTIKRNLKCIDFAQDNFPVNPEYVKYVDVFDHQSNGQWKIILLSVDAYWYLMRKFPPHCDRKKRKRRFTTTIKKRLF